MHRILKDALFIIDGSYLLYRSFYGLKPLHTSTGIPTQATYGFVRAIKKIIDDFDPQQIVIVWDSKGKNFRHELLPEYKATRMSPPSDLFMQKEQIFEFLNAISLCQTSQIGFEADDLVASLVTEHTQQQIIIVAPDKDLYQLLSDHVLVFDPFKDKLTDQNDFKKEHGFGSEKIPFFYALLGDSSDNIPGVEGVGKKTAQDLVIQFNSLDDLYANLDQVKKERTRIMLKDQKDQAYLSLTLFLLKPPHVGLTKQQLVFNKKNWAHAAPIFKTLEFSSLLRDIEKKFPSAIPNPTGQTSLFGTQDQAAQHAQPKSPVASTDTQPQLEQKAWTCTTVQTEEALERLCKLLIEKKYCGLDTETSGILPLMDKLVGISFAVDEHEAFYIPLGHITIEPQLDLQTVVQKLKPILEDPSTDLVMHNAKFDQLVLENVGITTKPVVFDTILAANLVRNEWQKINLKDLSAFFLQEPMTKYKDVMGKAYKTFDQVPIALGAEYGAHDALQTFKLKLALEKELAKEQTLQKVFDEMEMPFYPILLSMERTGIMLDISALQTVAAAVNTELAHIEKKLFSAFAAQHEAEKSQETEKINLNSPRQIETLLFDVLQLPVIKKSAKGSRSTDQEVLEELSKVHPIPGLILTHRELSKLKSTYLEPLPECVNPKTGRIHTSYSQTLVATGRLSSANPNMQNIPASGTHGIGIRSAFVAPTSKLFLSADYSQIELRVLAHLSQDTNLMDAFLHDKDIHAQTAAQLFDVSLDQVTTEQRQLGKRINFSIIYGLTPFGLAQDLNISPSAAKTYIDKYFAQYKGVRAWMDATVEQAIEKGYTQTVWGHRRHVPELREKNRMIFEAGKRIAINSPVQGTTADIMKVAMINLDKALRAEKLDALMILQIHDEIVLELPEHELDQVTQLVKKELENVVTWDVRLKASIRTGKNWGEITK